jgi:TfoX/Sxy family transcriptional regulator of competence genes
MATQKETIEFILEKLDDPKTFTARAMFGEYALYALGKVVALVCDDLLYVKIMPESAALAETCEQGEPYPGAKLYYIVTEDMLSNASHIAHMLVSISHALPVKKKQTKKKKVK